MSDNDNSKGNSGNSNNESSDKKNESLVIDKTKFGTVAPLTAVQVVSLLIKSDMAFGACACACACGPCY